MVAKITMATVECLLAITELPIDHQIGKCTAARTSLYWNIATILLCTVIHSYSAFLDLCTATLQYHTTTVQVQRCIFQILHSAGGSIGLSS